MRYQERIKEAELIIESISNSISTVDNDDVHDYINQSFAALDTLFWGAVYGYYCKHRYNDFWHLHYTIEEHQPKWMVDALLNAYEILNY